MNKTAYLEVITAPKSAPIRTNSRTAKERPMDHSKEELQFYGVVLVSSLLIWFFWIFLPTLS